MRYFAFSLLAIILYLSFFPSPVFVSDHLGFAGPFPVSTRHNCREASLYQAIWSPTSKRSSSCSPPLPHFPPNAFILPSSDALVTAGASPSSSSSTWSSSRTRRRRNFASFSFSLSSTSRLCASSPPPSFLLSPFLFLFLLPRFSSFLPFFLPLFLDADPHPAAAPTSSPRPTPLRSPRTSARSETR